MRSIGRIIMISNNPPIIIYTQTIEISIPSKAMNRVYFYIRAIHPKLLICARPYYIITTYTRGGGILLIH